MVSLREIRVYAFGALPPPLRAHPGNAQLRIKTALEALKVAILSIRRLTVGGTAGAPFLLIFTR